MRYHLSVDAVPQERTRTLCGKSTKDVWLLWEGASELVKDRYGCKSCLRIAGIKQPPDQGQEDHE